MKQLEIEHLELSASLSGLYNMKINQNEQEQLGEWRVKTPLFTLDSKENQKKLIRILYLGEILKDIQEHRILGDLKA
jgi:hypothetical protein